MRALPAASTLTLARIALAPFALLAAYAGTTPAFLVLLAVGFVTDVLDGAVARARGQASERGARLDSIADVVFYTTCLVGVAMLGWERVRVHWLLCSIVASSYVLPIAAGWWKFRTLTAYHTYIARVALVACAVGLPCGLLFGMTWALNLATIASTIAAIEELAITSILDAPKVDVQHIGRLLSTRTLRVQESVVRHPETPVP